MTGDSKDFPPELANLLAALQEERLDTARRERLGQLLRDYPAALPLYVELTQLRLLLEEELGGSPAAMPAGSPTNNPDVSSPSEAPPSHSSVSRPRLEIGPAAPAYRNAPTGFLGAADAEVRAQGSIIEWSKSDDDLPLTGPAIQRSRKGARWWQRMLRGAAIFVLGSGLTGMLVAAHNRGNMLAQANLLGQPLPPIPDPGPTPVVFIQGVATLSGTEKAVWTNGTTAVVLPSRELGTTPLHLESGLAELVFKDGAVVVVEGPAEFTPESPDGIIVQRGRLTVRKNSSGRPFVVGTPLARIQDVGTEFGVEVTVSGTIVEVFDGSISVTPGTPGDIARPPVELSAGEARRIVRGTGTLLPVKPGSIGFIRQREFEVRLDQSQPSAKSRWLAYSYQFRRDPSLIAYYTFDNATEAPDRLINRAASTTGKMDGELFGETPDKVPVWAAGRWPGTSSLQFNRMKGQYVRVPGHPAMDPTEGLTIAAWVQNDSPQNHGPIVSKWREVGGSTYQMGIVGDAALMPNSLQLWVGFEPGDQMVLQFSPARLERSTSWQLLAVTFDVRTRTKRFYANDRFLGERVGSQEMIAGSSDLYIGAEDPISGTLTSFSGRIAELCLLKRAMTDTELNQMYEAGKPE